MLTIDNFLISPDRKTFIIAELSANHGGDIDIVMDSMVAAKKAGANAIKLQTFTADTLTIDSKNDYFAINKGTPWDGQYLYDLYKEASLPWEWHEAIFDRARQEGIICFSSTFDSTAVDLLESLNTPAYKIASPEITDIPLIEYIAQKGKPIIFSTGMATLEDISLAIDACNKHGNDKIALLKCTSAYPTPLAEVNLRALSLLAEKYQCVIGLSDHTLGTKVAGAAVALGARIVEKHFILDRSIGGPDIEFSLDPAQFAELVTDIRDIETSLGEAKLDLTKTTRKMRNFCRSLFISSDVKKGDVLSSQNIRSVRPGNGMHPKHLPNVLGKSFTNNFDKGTPLHEGMFK